MSGPTVDDLILSAFTQSIQGLLLRSVLFVYNDNADVQSRDALIATTALGALCEYAIGLGSELDAAGFTTSAYANLAWRHAYISLSDVPSAAYDAVVAFSGHSVTSGAVVREGDDFICSLARVLKRGGNLLYFISSEACTKAAPLAPSAAEPITTEKIFTYIQKVSNYVADSALTYRTHFIHESCIIISFRKD